MADNCLPTDVNGGKSVRKRPAKPQVASPLPTVNIRGFIADQYQANGSRFSSVDSGGYLCLIDGRNRGVFAVNGVLNRPTYRAIAIEAKQHGLDHSILNVYGTVCTYTGHGLQFNNLPLSVR